MELFYYQSKNNAVYAKFLRLIDIRPEQILEASEIPFMPIDFFKNFKVISGETNNDEICFTSSSTSGEGVSKHYVRDIQIYHEAFKNSFEYFFDKIDQYTFRFLLPSYLEREGSSLIYMAKEMLSISGKGGFYLNDFEQLKRDLESDKKSENPTLLLGVSFALLDFAEQFPMDLSHVSVMETGGMKGKRKEMVRDELHGFLRQQFKVEQIASEYGMTELLSQAYSIGNGIFKCPPWMKVYIGQTTDPFASEQLGKTGLIKIIDLSNIQSCAFIATSDLGRVYIDGSFEILGRFDHSDARGCNLMVS